MSLHPNRAHAEAREVALDIVAHDRGQAARVQDREVALHARRRQGLAAFVAVAPSQLGDRVVQQTAQFMSFIDRPMKRNDIPEEKPNV